MCAENYQNRGRFDKDIAKNKTGQFFASHGISMVWCEFSEYAVAIGP